MARFSASDAALAGFKILREHWRVVVVGWSLFHVVALAALSIMGAIVTFGAMAAASAGAMPFGPALGGFVASLAEAFIAAVLAGGLFRLMLRPEEPAYLYLRIGSGELRILGVWVAMWFGAFLLAGLSAILVRLAGQAGPVLKLVIWLASVAAGVWLALRFSLAPVISFAERRFTLRSSWRLTRGRVGALLGMAALNLSVVALLSVIVSVVVLVATGLAVGFDAVFETMRDQDALRDHPGMYVADLVIQLILLPVAGVLLLAPWVAAYEAFRGEPEQA